MEILLFIFNMKFSLKDLFPAFNCRGMNGFESAIIFLAEESKNTAPILVNLGHLTLKFLLTALILYLCAAALQNIPFLQGFMTGNIGGLIVYILVLGASFFLTFMIPSIRLLHGMDLIKDPKAMIWVDIAFSALALSRTSQLWPMFIEWVERRLSGSGGGEF